MTPTLLRWHLSELSNAMKGSAQHNYTLDSTARSLLYGWTDSLDALIAAIDKDKPATSTVCKPTLTDTLCEARVMLEHVEHLNDLHYDECVEVYKLVETLKQLGAFVDGD